MLRVLTGLMAGTNGDQSQPETNTETTTRARATMNNESSNSVPASEGLNRGISVGDGRSLLSSLAGKDDVTLMDGEKYRQMQDELKKKEELIASLNQRMHHLERDYTRGAPRGRNSHQRKLLVEEVDVLNVDVAIDATNDIFAHVKFFPHGWDRLVNKPKHISMRLMKKVNVPAKYTSSAFYYREKIVPAINKKIIEKKSNFTQKIRGEWMSEEYHFEFVHCLYEYDDDNITN